MKIGMITFHRARNIGANLQAYALNKYINDNIGQCEIIDFYPNNQTAHKSWFRKILSKVKSLVLYRNNGQNRKYAQFQKNYYILSPKTYYGDAQIQACHVHYDILISGSDQILNTTLSGDSKSYYLFFDNQAKKVSYASSFGRNDLSKNEIFLIDTELVRFQDLSVREKSAGKIIENRIGITPQNVLDPVFLLEANSWEQIGIEHGLLDEYIFVYAMEVTEYLRTAIKKAKIKYQLPVFIVYGCEENRDIDGYVISDCGPAEFVSYIRNASYVITNSFHGTAFSIIFEKCFFCVAHSIRNERLENIMTLVAQQERLINSFTPEYDIGEYIVDGGKALSRLSQQISDSKAYLQRTCNLQEK